MRIILADPPSCGDGRDIYLPIIATEHANPVAAFYRLTIGDERQQRTALGASAPLELAAEWKAADIILHDYWSHRTYNGEWPNATVRHFGCNLPPEYGNDWNGCESLVAGSPDPMVMFNALAESPAHRVHLFGENDFFRQQTHMGVAVATGGQWGWVWVVLIARCA